MRETVTAGVIPPPTQMQCVREDILPTTRLELPVMLLRRRPLTATLTDATRTRLDSTRYFRRPGHQNNPPRLADSRHAHEQKTGV